MDRALRLGLAREPNATVRTDWGPRAAAKTDLPLGKLHICEVATRENTPWEVAVWENVFEKVPNIVDSHLSY